MNINWLFSRRSPADSRQVRRPVGLVSRVLLVSIGTLSAGLVHAQQSSARTFLVQGIEFSSQACAREGRSCTLSESRQVAYGARGAFRVRTLPAGTFGCHNGVFGDPIRGRVKSCFIGPVVLGNAPTSPSGNPGGTSSTPVASGNSSTPGARPPAPSPGTTAPRGVSAADLSAPTYSMADPAVQALLRVWNRPDSLGMACVHCHASPNAVEFALAGINPGDILRRGLPHHPEEEILKISEGLAVLKTIYGLAERNRDEVFLMQPGGRPTEGRTWMERDYNFLRTEIPKHTPTFATRIDTLDQARQALAEFQALTNAEQIRIPAVSPPYSADSVDGTRLMDRGERTGSIHKWVSFMPIQPLTNEDATKIEAARQAYMAQPSNFNFYTYYRAIEVGAGVLGEPASYFRQHPDITGVDLNEQAAKYERNKYLAALLAFHVELQRATGQPSLLSKGRDALMRIGSSYNATGFDAFNPMQFAGDATGGPIGNHRLNYPAFITRTLAAPMNTSVNTSRGNTVTYHARQGAQPWWAFSLHYDPTRQAVGTAYWLSDMAIFGTQANNPPNRGRGLRVEDSIPGYPSFFVWAFTRGQALHLLPGGYPFPSQWMALDSLQMNGLLNREAWLNEQHGQKLITLGLNSVKIQAVTYIDYVNRRIAAGQRVDRNGRRGFNELFPVFLEFARQSSDPREVQALELFYDEWKKALNRGYAFPEEYRPVPGQGSGLTGRTFDQPGFVQPTGSLPAAAIAYSFLSEPDAERFATQSFFKLHAMTGMRDSPVPQWGGRGYSVLWEGQVQAPFTDDYDFFLYTPHGRNSRARVIVNGVQTYISGPGYNPGLADSAGRMSPEGRRVWPKDGTASRVRLQAGQRYDIRVEIENLRDERFHAVLYWQSPRFQAAEVVPAQYLYAQ